jgi:hypothetical protein
MANIILRPNINLNTVKIKPLREADMLIETSNIISFLLELEFHVFRPNAYILAACTSTWRLAVKHGDTTLGCEETYVRRVRRVGGTKHDAPFAVNVTLVQGFKVNSGSEVITSFLVAIECKAISSALRGRCKRRYYEILKVEVRNLNQN